MSLFIQLILDQRPDLRAARAGVLSLLVGVIGKTYEQCRSQSDADASIVVRRMTMRYRGAFFFRLRNGAGLPPG
jgi:hypothetical protein